MGVTSAFQDAVILTECIGGGDTPLAEALLKYERERRIPATLLQVLSRIAMVLIENILCR